MRNPGGGDNVGEAGCAAMIETALSESGRNRVVGSLNRENPGMRAALRSDSAQPRPLVPTGFRRHRNHTGGLCRGAGGLRAPRASVPGKTSRPGLGHTQFRPRPRQENRRMRLLVVEDNRNLVANLFDYF